MMEQKLQEQNTKNGFRINMYFDKDGNSLQKVMENNLIIYYQKAIYSKQ